MVNRNPPQSKMKKHYPDGYFKDKPCKRCRTPFSPQAPSHLHCCQLCADESIADNVLLNKYNITLDEYREILIEQDNKCKICDGEGFVMAEYHWKKLVVDHCHKTGKVRGLLCHNCNRGLGLFQENSSNLERACAYVEEHEEKA